MIRKELRVVAVSKGEMGIMADDGGSGRRERDVIRVARSVNLHRLPNMYYADVNMSRGYHIIFLMVTE